MSNLLGLIRYGLLAIFGIVLSAEFADVLEQKQAKIKLSIYIVFILIVQALCWKILGIEATFQLYPFITHLPLIFLLVFVFHSSWIISTVSVLTAYLCCQLPRWCSDAMYVISDNFLFKQLFHIVAITVIYYLIHFYIVLPMQKLLSRSRNSAIIVGILPFLYYIFDYSTTIYSDLLYSGNPYVVQFMPSVVSTAYFLFLLAYYTKLEEQEKNQQERDLLILQLRRSEAEYKAMLQMQEQARQYRHDLRHHFSLLMELAQTKDYDKMLDYLQKTQNQLDIYSTQHFCGNQVIDLILSYFMGYADKLNVKLTPEIAIPASLPFQDNELCSLLSNALENAILSASQVEEPTQRIVQIKMNVRQMNLLISIQNPFIHKISFKNGIPVSHKKDHGYGTKSIVSIVNKYSGQVSFSTKDQTFLLRIVLPIQEN